MNHIQRDPADEARSLCTAKVIHSILWRRQERYWQPPGRMARARQPRPARGLFSPARTRTRRQGQRPTPLGSRQRRIELGSRARHRFTYRTVGQPSQTLSRALGGCESLSPLSYNPFTYSLNSSGRTAKPSQTSLAERDSGRRRQLSRLLSSAFRWRARQVFLAAFAACR